MLRIFTVFLYCLFSFQIGLIALTPSEEAYRVLDGYAIEAGTDKSSLQNHHTKVYGKLFLEQKDLPIKFLEIGIFKGNSAKMWERFFKNASLYFMDVNQDQIEYWSERSKYHFLDQANPKQLEDYITSVGGDFDIIIDDGGHTMKQQITSFNTLFPYVKAGGMYVIEDLCTSYWRYYGGMGTFDVPKAGPTSTIEFLKKRVDDLNYYTARLACADYDKLSSSFVSELRTYQKDIESIHFYPNICVIIKR